MIENNPERWHVEYDDFGRPMVRHRHATETVEAYLSRTADGFRVARCPRCSEEYLLNAERQ
jgi:hypothetical protein